MDYNPYGHNLRGNIICTLTVVVAIAVGVIVSNSGLSIAVWKLIYAVLGL